MSPASNAIERLASRHGVPPLEAMEYFLVRLAIREHDDSMSRAHAELAAIADVELWARLWIAVKGEPGPQMTLKVGAGK